MKLYAPSTIKELKEKHGFRLSKSLGQNFLTDKNIIDHIIEDSLISQNDLVIEIGPGIGVLTAEAAQVAAKVIAIEIDQGLIPILQETLREYDNVTVVNQDVLKTDLKELIRENHCGGVRIIGNLPYYITTPILMKILEDRVPADSITVMMQKEVADRIKSAPGNKTYGALSVAVQYYCTVEQILSVSREVFIPQPKVDSTVLRMDVRKEHPVELTDEKVFFQCIKAGFEQRRKTLLNSLSGTAGLGKDAIRDILAVAGIDPVRRPETLDLREFAAIANFMVDYTKDHQE
ncbi:MAG: 16S rRNA (adenine(1518)-N(6)/adenine(1519)-N(6))-dimethyltransferase RsmA [Firmicutes bacterium]|jgi:16S rRNA (adenine1518-N6/adenine1519-N6)-dimethyltransferase|nr:16S rRNA (adenine(1518)-N(6)/adenine(1519)-N(6))-dimethyltransferase RsmA [Bacillota bacterium]NBI62643.1 16S rRNA (adenine(1518)-N(6)/adenine(1519)-N(6))-dimethyltransferase RsmA [Clostridiales bacterium]